MARQINKLSDLKVKRAKTPGYLADGAGLFLQISPSLSKSWVLRYTSPVTGKPREMGLGSIHTWGLAEARQRAREHRQQVDLGIDPIQAKADQRAALAAESAKALTFKDAAERFIAAKKAEWKNEKHQDQWGATLEAYAYPVIGHLPVHAIDVGLVMKILEPIWSEKTETATRVRGRIERILDWATARNHRSGENPARWRGHLETLLASPAKIAKEKPQPALPYVEISGFMADLRRRPSASADALELLILTAVRTEPVIGARWTEIDFDARVWTVPAERMKTPKEHRIPLSAPALALLERRFKVRTSDVWVFPGAKNKPMSNGAMLELVKGMHESETKSGRRGYVDPKQLDDDGKPRRVVPHGFRSTFEDWSADQTAFPKHVLDMALAHAISDKVEAAYRRGDLFAKRTKLMDAWAAYALAVPREGKVISMRKQA